MGTIEVKKETAPSPLYSIALKEQGSPLPKKLKSIVTIERRGIHRTIGRTTDTWKLPSRPSLSTPSPHQRLSPIQPARFLRLRPPQQPIRNITRIAMRRHPLLQHPTLRHRARIIAPRRPIIRTDILRPTPIHTLHQPIPIIRARRPIPDHALNLILRTRLQQSVLVAGAGAVVGLHQPWVAHAVVGGGHAHAAPGLLHYDREDEAVVEMGFLGDGLDRVAQVGEFGVGVVGHVEDAFAGGGHDVLVILPPALPTISSNILYPNPRNRKRRGGGKTYISSNDTQSSTSGHPSSVLPVPL